MNAEQLIIFAKNAVAGKVKTRLAATVGNKEALKIYNCLLAIIKAVTDKFSGDKIIYYSDFIQHTDSWDSNYLKTIQNGNDLGERMLNAMDNSFEMGYSKVILIGTDCPFLSVEIIDKAFASLNDNDVVIGPAYDGGYYLIGMKKRYAGLFQGIKWSTDTVLKESELYCTNKKLKYALLPMLNDIDTAEDLQYLDALTF